MTKWIAVPAGALLFAAAWGRPVPALPFIRRPAPPVDAPLLAESPAPLPFLEALAGTLLPSTSVVKENSEPSHQNAVWAEVARLLDQAYAAVYDERHLRAVGACEEILRIDPHYGVAGELRRLAQLLGHIKVGNYDSIYRAIEPWVVRTGPASIPYPETFRLPSREEWAELYSRDAGGDEDAASEAIQRKLVTMKIDLDVENTKIEDILAIIRDVSSLNIMLDAAIRDHVDLDKAITFKVKDLDVENTLKLLLAQFQLDYFITEERVVLLTDFKRPARDALFNDGGRAFLPAFGLPDDARVPDRY